MHSIHPYSIREATRADAPTIARQRALMFRDMGSMPEALVEPLAGAGAREFDELVATGAYHGWLAEGGEGEGVVAGIGVLVRMVATRPLTKPSGEVVLVDREGLVMNAYVTPSHRRRGLARTLLGRVLAWTREEGLHRVILHASSEGRALYEELGFVSSNEMRHRGLDGPMGS
ncbi:MAG: hypothetical protein AMXMBFR53_05110 [Gemmatimonadota bacterium]